MLEKPQDGISYFFFNIFGVSIILQDEKENETYYFCFSICNIFDNITICS